MSSLFQPSLGTVIAVTPTLQMLQPLNRRHSKLSWILMLPYEKRVRRRDDM
ncbi:hypothetical protein SHILAN_43 [Mycobacterium phage ShiLan]|uniref:Uncharacterized protein n=2 Tax=Cheoctovirus TaxID=1623281 RepID=G1DUN7_9CAUD|nr:hypothetical protein AU088_gp044 [Mycobacterium phage Cabrinians]YP_009608118.1 hypothetical protein FDI15_gp043 [Mycobacterium phage ShiLan]YP_009961661.1 hypothetical protein I5H82_gp043 [Mycobacterium phage Priscilla]AEJ93230.1 hypothetical protein SHILAN_43 [Mycobacterium phage ShiLan]ALM02304.1 hypothetical protein SEA_CABRINIANS_44 [Mycobacterium phage Cabrinians]AVI04296.1 hypothetical protein SEA_PRISCILLA_43 [Mycobacterium phage Priscilla]